MEIEKVREDNSNKHYTFNVSVTFNMQYTFTSSEVQPAEEGGCNDVDPSDEALAALAKEIEEYLSINYPINDIEVFSDFDDLLGIDGA